MITTSQLHQLAKVYAASYASPHHITFTLAGLTSLLHDAMRMHIDATDTTTAADGTRTQDPS